ncbi:MAG: low molecular weight phosphatase family protein [Ruminococcus sp.]|nr:low molecular weight phosphatase family protein [Ruminococcus sp.]
MRKILYVCTGNTCRSPMAAGIFNKYAEKYNFDVRAESAGLDTVDGLPASENAVKVCQEIGVDISEHRSKRFQECNPDDYLRICTMNFDHTDKLIEFGVPVNKIEVTTGADHGIPDPYGFGMGIYRSCRDIIKRSIEDFFENRFEDVQEELNDDK